MTTLHSSDSGAHTCPWNAITDEVTRDFPLAVSEPPNGLRLVLLVGGATRVGVRLRHERTDERTMIVMTADLGVADRLTPAEALVTNSQLIHGSLATAGHTLVLRAVVFVDRLANEELGRQIRYLAAEAAAIKELLVVPLINTAAFSHFAD